MGQLIRTQNACETKHNKTLGALGQAGGAREGSGRPGQRENAERLLQVSAS